GDEPAGSASGRASRATVARAGPSPSEQPAATASAAGAPCAPFPCRPRARRAPAGRCQQARCPRCSTKRARRRLRLAARSPVLSLLPPLIPDGPSRGVERTGGREVGETPSLHGFCYTTLGSPRRG